MKATTESHFNQLPYDNGRSTPVISSNQDMVTKVKALLHHLDQIPKGYRRDLVTNARDKITYWGETSINLQFSYNESIMLDRLYENYGGVR